MKKTSIFLFVVLFGIYASDNVWAVDKKNVKVDKAAKKAATKAVVAEKKAKNIDGVVDDKNLTQREKLHDLNELKHKMTPEEFLAIIEENHRLKTQLNEAQAALANTAKADDATVKSLNDKVDELTKQLNETTVKYKALSEAVEKQGYDDSYNDVDMAAMLNSSKSADKNSTTNALKSGLGDSDGVTVLSKEDLGKVSYKVQVGVFNDYDAANKLKDKLRELGNKTWIICICNGKRIPMNVIRDAMTKYSTPSKGNKSKTSKKANHKAPSNENSPAVTTPAKVEVK